MCVCVWEKATHWLIPSCCIGTSWFRLWQSGMSHPWQHCAITLYLAGVSGGFESHCEISFHCKLLDYCLPENLCQDIDVGGEMTVAGRCNLMIGGGECSRASVSMCVMLWVPVWPVACLVFTCPHQSCVIMRWMPVLQLIIISLCAAEVVYSGSCVEFVCSPCA